MLTVDYYFELFQQAFIDHIFKSLDSNFVKEVSKGITFEGLYVIKISVDFDPKFLTTWTYPKFQAVKKNQEELYKALQRSLTNKKEDLIDEVTYLFEKGSFKYTKLGNFTPEILMNVLKNLAKAPAISMDCLTSKKAKKVIATANKELYKECLAIFAKESIDLGNARPNGQLGDTLFTFRFMNKRDLR